MKHLWIIGKTASTNLFYRNYSDNQLDPDLISGFLAALNNFSEVELRGHGIESINMSGLQWCYLTDEPLSLLLIACDSKSGNAELLRARLEVIKNIFVQNYNITPEFFKQGLINVNQFNDFGQTLDILVDQWRQAEKALGAAAMFDLLGIFQQIFNLFIQIIKSNAFGEKYSQIMGELKEIYDNFQKSPDLQQYPELGNITFDEQQGWNIITLNPINLDENMLKRTLFIFTKQMRSILIKRMGYMVALNAMSRELFPYISSNWELLDRLMITKTLMDVFLERVK